MSSTNVFWDCKDSVFKSIHQKKGSRLIYDRLLCCIEKTKTITQLPTAHYLTKVSQVDKDKQFRVRGVPKAHYNINPALSLRGAVWGDRPQCLCVLKARYNAEQ